MKSGPKLGRKRLFLWGENSDLQVVWVPNLVIHPAARLSATLSTRNRSILMKIRSLQSALLVDER
jgi:hypothetical protein